MPPGAAAEGRRQAALRALSRRSSGAPAVSAGSAVTQAVSGRDARPAASGTAGGGGGAATDGGGDALRQEALTQAARLEGANVQLRERLADALDELNVAHSQLRILQGLQRQLEDATPGAADLVAAAVEQERALQAARDAQVLQLLRAKDEVIESFEARYAESRAEAAQYKEQLGAAQEKLENSQLRVGELVQSKAELRKQLDQAAAAGADAEAALRGEAARLKEEAAACKPLQRQVQVLEQQLADARADLGSANQQLQTLADTVDAANAAITEVQAMLTEREDAVAQKEAEAQELHRHLAKLLGLPPGEAQLVHQAQRGGGQPGMAQAEARLAALEAANERLEAALVESTRSAAAAAGGLHTEPSASGSDADAVGELTAQLAMATGKLQAAEERVAQLEKLLKVAEATVLHNEVQLQDSLEGRMCAEEQVHSLRLELEDGQALLEQLKAKLGELTEAQQAAHVEAAAVRSTLASIATGLPQLHEQDAGGRQPAKKGSEQAARSSGAHVAAGSHSSSGLEKEVGSAVGALLRRIAALEEQVAGQQEAAAAAAATAAQHPAALERQEVEVQCEPPAQSAAAVQTVEGDAAPAGTEAIGTQTDAGGSLEAGAAGQTAYGRPDAQQQQVAELTAQLAAARLDVVAVKAEHSATEARLLEAEHRLDEQLREKEAAARHSLDCTCPAATQLRAAVGELQAKLDELGISAAAAQQEGEARLARAASEAQAQQQALQAQLSALQSGAGELRELRSSAYATVTRIQQALKEQGAEPAALPDGCEPGPLPQQLRRAADQLLSMLQEHSELVAAFQQHMQQGAGLPGAEPSSSSASGTGMPLEGSQRAVIRSLAAQVAGLQLRLEQAGVEQHHLQDRVQLLRSTLAPAGSSEAAAAAAGSPDARTGMCLPAAWRQQSVPSIPGDAGTLVGMLVLLKQQLSGLDRIQQQLAAQGIASPGVASPARPASSCESGRLGQLPGIAHAAALLGTELPALHATAAVMEGEVRRMVAGAEGSTVSAGSNLCLPAAASARSDATFASPAAAAEDAVQRGDKWKGRCKDLQAKLVAAEQASTKRAATVQLLQLRVEELATAGSQLEAGLQETAQQLTDALQAAGEMDTQMHQQQQQHAEAEQRFQAQLGSVGRQLAASEAALGEQRQQNSELADRLEGLEASLQSSGGAEGQLRSQLQELGEQVAVLTAAQEAAKVEVLEQRQALTAAQQELGAARAGYDQLAAEKQRRELELAARLEALQEECSTLLAVVERAEEQQAQVEQRFRSQLAVLGSQLAEFGDDTAANAPTISAGIGRLQQMGDALELRLLRLEAQAAVAAEDRQNSAAARWAHLVRSRRYRSAVKKLRDGLQADLLTCRAACDQQAAQLSQLQAVLSTARTECAQLSSQLQDAQLRHQQDLQRAAMEQQQALEAQRQEVQQEWQQHQQMAEAATAAAVAAAEERCRLESAARACQLQQRAISDVEAAQQQCSELQAQLGGVRSEFKRYQAIKAVEVRLLEQRVMRQLRGAGRGAGAGAEAAPAAAAASDCGSPKGAQPATLDELEAACDNDSISAALREARLERLQRQKLEGELAAARQAEEQLSQLRGRAKASEQELAATRSRQAGERERAEQLAAELADCQAALRLAKAEGSRRVKELQALQRQVSASENSGPNVTAQLEGEQEARKAAEMQLREARQALARKAELIKDLRSKVASLEHQLAAQDPAPLAAELEACQGRLRQTQAACGSKEAAVRELRERLEQQTRLARQEGILEERWVQEVELLRLGKELTDRDAQLSALQQQLRQLHQELAAATSSLQATAAGHSAEAHHAAARLAEARQCVQHLAGTLRMLLVTLAQLGVAAASATTAGQSCSQDNALAAAAGDIATLVDLSPDDIGAVLLPAAGQAGGTTNAASVDAVAQQAWAALEQLEAHAGEERWQQAHECSAPLHSAVGALHEQCSDVATALSTGAGRS